MIQLTELKSLLLAQGTHVDRHPHLSAASGLVQVGPWLYVVADDELHLGQFLLEGKSFGRLHRCFAGELPLESEERKAEKPDIEVLMLLPDFSAQASLLAFGSGSKKNRHRSALISLDANGNIHGSPELIELEKFYEFLKGEIGKLNIEGAAVVEDSMYLFQRGNKKNNLNASIRLSLADFYKVLRSPDKKFAPHIDITPYDLGDIDNVPLCFTDATPLSNGDIVFTASAENTSDSYLDGQCMGSSIGLINRAGDLVLLEPIDKTVKLEGVEADQKGNNIELLLVTDADDPEQPALLYTANLKHPS